MRYIKFTILLLCITVLATVSFHAARAQINPMLNFAGKVTNTDGSELPDGVYDFSFGLYTSPAGGTALWTEDLTAATRFSGTISGVASGATSTVYSYGGGLNASTLRIGQYLSAASSSEGALIVDYNNGAGTVTVASGSPLWSIGRAINNRPFVEGGVININLGSVSDLSGVDFNQTLYLEIIFNSETMRPRKILSSVSGAFEASRLGGKTESELAALIENETITGQWSFENILDVSATSASAALTVTQNGSGALMEIKQGTTTRFAVLSDGRVQIGDYRFPLSKPGTAGYVLKVDAAGNLYWEADFTGNFGVNGKTLWATSSDESRIYPIDTGYTVVIGNNATTTFSNQIFEVYGTSLFDDILIGDQQELRFYDADNSNYISLRASSTVPSNVILTLPADAGTANQALITDGNGNLSWGSPTSFTYVNPGTAGQLPYYAENGSALSATSSIFLSPAGYFGIGTTTPANLLSVGAISGGQFMVDENGQVTEGVWQGTAITDAYIASSSYWNAAYNWGNHAEAGYFATSTGNVLEVAYGGTGQTTLNNLITLGAHTTGNYVASTTGSNTITITGVPGEGWVPVFSVTDNSITAAKLAVVNNGSNGQVLISDGDGTFSWSDAGASSGWVRYGDAGALAYYASAGIQATGTNLLYWDNTGSRLGIGTTSPTETLTIGATVNSQFLVNSSGVVIGGVWNATPITDAYIASSTYWNLAYFGRVNGATNNITFTNNQIGVVSGRVIPLIASTSEWNTAYNWGNHAEAGYFSTSSGHILDVAYGGTGSTTWTQYAIPYLAASDNFGQIKIGSSTYLLAVNASANGYTWVEASSTGTVLSQEQVDDYVDALINDADSVHTRINIVYDDADNAMDFTVDGDLSHYDNSASAFFSTSSGPLAVNYGGTGKTSWTQHAILFATTTGELGEIAIGAPSRILAVNGSGTGYEWISSGSVGADELVAVDGGAAAGYLGAAANDGVLRASSPLSYADGGDYITLGITADSIGNTQLEYDTGQNLTTASAPTFAGLSLNNFGTGLITITADVIGTTTNNTAAWNAVAASSTYYNLTYNIVDANNANWNAAYASTTAYDAMYASSTNYDWTYNTVNDNYASWDAVAASSSAYNLTYNRVNDNYANWNTAYGWGNHAEAGYFSTSSGHVLEVAYGGTGQTSLADLIALGADTTGNYVASTTGSNTITITGVPGEGWVPVFSVTANSIGATQLNVSGNGNNGYVLTSNGDGSFSWTDSSGSGQVKYGQTGALAYYSSAGITATGTSLLYWDDTGSRLAIGTTTPGGMLTVGATSSAQFIVNNAGQVIAGSWLADVIDIAHGGTGATTATSARENLDLENIHKFAINSTGTVGWLWQSDGDGRGHWVATGTLGLGGGGGSTNARFIGTTTLTTNGAFASSTLRGYQAANAMCADEYSNSFFCRTYDIIVSIDKLSDISTWKGTAWIAEGPPGYTSNSNDCKGWTASSSVMMGAFWEFNPDGGGMGWLTNCSVNKPLACCREE